MFSINQNNHRFFSKALFQWISTLILMCHQNLCSTTGTISVTGDEYNGLELVTDMCDHEIVESAAHLVFEDNFERYFISNGQYYWLLNLTTDKPDVGSAYKFPYGFKPDAALLKDTRKCSNGLLSLMLIQMKTIPDSSETEWLTLEARIEKWNTSGSSSIFWNEINKVAHCDLKTKSCTTTDNLFATMSFDFKLKLDAAFGTIGDVAYYLQGEKMYKVHYRKQCIENPYTDVISYPGVSIGTTITAALSFSEGNTTVILFDKDVNFNLTVATLENINLDSEISNPSNWKDNNYLFEKCDQPTLSLLVQDLFSGSKRYYYVKRVILFILIALIISTMILVSVFIFISCFGNRTKRQTTRPKEIDSGNDENLIEKPDFKIMINSPQKNDKQENLNENHEKDLLQTSC